MDIVFFVLQKVHTPFNGQTNLSRHAKGPYQKLATKTLLSNILKIATTAHSLSVLLANWHVALQRRYHRSRWFFKSKITFDFFPNYVQFFLQMIFGRWWSVEIKKDGKLFLCFLLNRPTYGSSKNGKMYPTGISNEQYTGKKGTIEVINIVVYRSSLEIHNFCMDTAN